MPPLLARSFSRSECDPDTEVAAAGDPRTHPITGAFVDPLQPAFAAHIFRLVFPCHIFVMALGVGYYIWATLRVSERLLPIIGVSLYLPLTCGAVGLVCRWLLHRMHDSVRSQRIGSWTWTATFLAFLIGDTISFTVTPADFCKENYEQQYMLPFISLVAVLINGSHGLSWVHKNALLVLILLDCLAMVAVCDEAEFHPMLGVAAMCLLGSAFTHVSEGFMRHNYAEKKRLEQRNEQLQAEKERLLYDMQRRGRLLDDTSDRSAIRRGLQAGTNQPDLYTDGMDQSEAGAPTPSESPPSSLPPGAPSSTGSGGDHCRVGRGRGGSLGTSAALPLTWAEADRRHYAEMAAVAAVAQGLTPGAPSSTPGILQGLPPGTPSSTPRALHGMPPRAPSSVGTGGDRRRAGRGRGGPRSRKASKSTALPVTWAEADRRHYAEVAAMAAVAQGLPPGAPSSTPGAPQEEVPPGAQNNKSRKSNARSSTPRAQPQTASSTSTALPRSWAEADRQHYAEMTLMAATEPRTVPLSLPDAAGPQLYARAGVACSGVALTPLGTLARDPEAPSLCCEPPAVPAAVHTWEVEMAGTAEMAVIIVDPEVVASYDELMTWLSHPAGD